MRIQDLRDRLEVLRSEVSQLEAKREGAEAAWAAEDQRLGGEIRDRERVADELDEFLRWRDERVRAGWEGGELVWTFPGVDFAEKWMALPKGKRAELARLADSAVDAVIRGEDVASLPLRFVEAVEEEFERFGGEPAVEEGGGE